jgi:hypothetical protein
VRLFEHPDFDQFVLGATEHFRSQGLRPAIIEKDYYEPGDKTGLCELVGVGSR